MRLKHRTDLDKFVATVQELLQPNSALPPSSLLKPAEPISEKSWLADLVGCSPQMEAVRQQIKRLSQFPGVPILITGETGTGKEVVANLLHASSLRADKPLIKVNCSAIPESLFESHLFGHRKGAFTGAHSAQKGLVEAAQDGTLFLDEISTLKLELQPKLLRLLENGSYLSVGETLEGRTNAWIIAASNENLAALVQKKLFRADLYFRLKAAEINLPPLRERREDVSLLSKKFLEQFSSQYGVGDKCHDIVDKISAKTS